MVPSLKSSLRILTVLAAVLIFPVLIEALGPFGYIDQDSSIGGVAIAGGAEAGDEFGGAVVFGDFNNDGYDDMAVGAPGEAVSDNDYDDAGAVNVIYGSSTGFKGSGNQLWSLEDTGLSGSPDDDDRFGAALAVGDFNNDGRDDLAVGIPGRNSDAGAVGILYGSAVGLRSTGFQYWTRNSSLGGIPVEGSSSSGDEFGFALAVGDFNQDGADDLAIGAPWSDYSSTNSGAINVLYGRSGSGLTADGNQVFSPGVALGSNSGEFGYALAAGDFNRDGADDLAVGMPGYNGCSAEVPTCNNKGAIKVLTGSWNGLNGSGGGTWAPTSSPLLGQFTTGIPGSGENDDRFGAALAAADFNQDGFADLAVAAPHEDIGDKTDAGWVGILYGYWTGLVTTGATEWHQDIDGIKSVAYDYEEFGAALAVGDFNSDGYPDLAIGTPGDQSAGNAVGSVTILFSNSSGVTSADAHWTQNSDGVPGGEQDDDRFGAALAVGDWFGRGFAGLAVGVPGEDGDAGAVNPLYGLTNEPRAFSQAVTVAEDGQITITLKGADSQGDPVAFIEYDIPAHGFLTPFVTTGSGTATTVYTPDPDYAGTDSFKFRVQRDGVNSTIATVSIAVTPVNDRPTLSIASVTTREDWGVDIPVTIGDRESGNPSLRFVGWPSAGTVNLTLFNCYLSNGQLGRCIQYQPDANWSGTDQFSVEAWDGQLASTPVTVSVVVEPVNDPPFANAGSATLLEDKATTIVLSGGDVDGDPITYTVLSPGHGTLGPIEDGCFHGGTSYCKVVTYTPFANYSGADHFWFRVSDGRDFRFGLISLTVTAVNDAPVLSAPPAVSVDEDTVAQIPLTFSDVETAVNSLTLSVVTPPTYAAQFSIQRTPTGAVMTYRGRPDFNGTDSIAARVSDGAAVSATAVVTVTVRPVNDAPTMTALPSQTLEATGAGGAVATFDAVAGDVEDNAVVAVCTPASGSLFPVGITTVSCTATDTGGATASGTFTVTVRDTIAPMITAPVDVTVSATSAAGAVVVYTSPATQDIVDGAGVATCAPASGLAFPIGTTTVTCTAADTAGNSVTDTFTVSVTNNAPTLTAPGAMTVEATSASGAVVAFAAAGQDVEDGMLPATCAPASGSTFALGTTTVSCEVADVAGATASGSFTVTVRDTTAPAMIAPADISVRATSASGAVVTYATPVTQDVVDGSGVATCAPASGSTFVMGATTVTCSAADAAGNSASATFTVSVTNNAPVFTAPNAMTVEATSAAGAVVTFVVVGQDVEDGALAATCAPASGSVFALGTTQVSCSVTDVAGASTAGTFAVTVHDTTAPLVVFSGQQAVYDISETVVIGCATGDAVGVVSTTCVNIASPATSFVVGVNTVTATATDAAGNTGSASVVFTVEVSSDGLQSLVTEILGADAQPMLTTLESAASAPNVNAKAGKVAAFKNQVRAQRGKKLTAAEADLLLALVDRMQ